MVFGVFSPGRTQCIAQKKIPDKAMSIWNLHKKFQLSSAMGLRDFDLQSQPTLMGGEPINCRAVALVNTPQKIECSLILKVHIQA